MILPAVRRIASRNVPVPGLFVRTSRFTLDVDRDCLVKKGIQLLVAAYVLALTLDSNPHAVESEALWEFNPATPTSIASRFIVYLTMRTNRKFTDHGLGPFHHGSS
jgi:hypothetical protein